MDTSNSIKISIPKPCHEDWNKMTPNEQGSFCSTCCKTVIDFTTRSIEEIKSTLLEYGTKKVCGRFRSDQLDEAPKLSFNLAIPLYRLPKNISYERAFAIALFLVFSATLFSCGTQQGEVIGKSAVDVNTTIKTQQIDTTKKETKILGDTIIKQRPIKMGKVKY